MLASHYNERRFQPDQNLRKNVNPILFPDMRVADANPGKLYRCFVVNMLTLHRDILTLQSATSRAVLAYSFVPVYGLFEMWNVASLGAF